MHLLHLCRGTTRASFCSLSSKSKGLCHTDLDPVTVLLTGIHTDSPASWGVRVRMSVGSSTATGGREPGSIAAWEQCLDLRPGDRLDRTLRCHFSACRSEVAVHGRRCRLVQNSTVLWTSPPGQGDQTPDVLSPHVAACAHVCPRSLRVGITVPSSFA